MSNTSCIPSNPLLSNASKISHHGWPSTSDRTWCKASFPLGHIETLWSSTEPEGRSNVVTDTVEGDLLDAGPNILGEDLLDIASDRAEGVLLDAVTDTADEEVAEVMVDAATGGLAGVETDTVDEGFLGRATGMVAGATVSYHSEARKPARLRLKSSKSFLVILIQSTIGVPSASQ